MRAFQNIVSILLAANAAASSQTAAITPNNCEERYNALDFQFSQFARYDEFFHRESSLRFYSAGEFVGPDRIQDYMYFVYSSPYFFGDVLDMETGLKRIDQDVCVFTRNSIAVWRWNSALTKDYPDTAFGAYTQVSYNITSNKIDHAELYYSKPFLTWLYGDVLATPKTNEYSCSTIINRCGGDPGADVMNESECMDRMEQLPQTTNDVYIDGNSVGCRVVNAIFATYNPKVNCPHLMFEPVPDPYGGIACQQSKLFNPDDVFDDEDYAAFDALQEKHGIDPMVGYKFVDDTSEKSQMKSKGLRLVTES